MKDDNIAALTGLRFIAALAVFVSHFPIPGFSNIAGVFMASGYAWVTFFFILSGFVLSYHYFAVFSFFKFKTLRNFFAIRFARIYPLYLFSMLMAWAISGAKGNLMPYLLAVQTWSPNLHVAYGINGPGWSVCVECFLYALFPLLALVCHQWSLFCSPKRLAISFAIILLLLLALPTCFVLYGGSILPRENPVSAHRWLYRMPLTRLLDFSLGMLAAEIYKRFKEKPRFTAATWSYCGYGSFLLVLMLMSWKRNFFSAYSYDAIYALPFFLLILSVSINPDSWLSKLSGSKYLVILGETSYAFYLMHQPIVKLFFRGSILPPGKSLLSYAFIFILTLCLAYGLHRIVENPCRIYLRRLLSSKDRKSISHQPVVAI